MRFRILCFLFLGLAHALAAQPAFQKQVAGVNGLFCLEQNLAGDFWIGTFLGKILQFSSDGQALGGYELKYGDTTTARYVYDLHRLPDGGMLALYDRSNFNTNLDDYLIVGRFDAAGQVVWQQTVHYGEVQHWAHNRMCTDASGNIFVMSAQYAGAGTDKLLILSKLTPQGALLWRKAYFNAGANYARDLRLLSNGDLLLCGNGQLASAYGFFLRIDADGNVVSSKRFPDFFFKDILEKPDGNWLFAATAKGPLPQKAVVMETDTAGALVWANRLEMPNALNWSPTLAFVPNGDVVVFNYETPSDEPVADMLCLSPSGQFRWARKFDRCHNYGISAGIGTADGGLATLRFRPGGHLFLKTDAQGFCPECMPDSLTIPLTPVTGNGFPLTWETQAMPPLNPAKVDFLPFSRPVSAFCGNQKPVDSLLVFPLEPCTNQPVNAQTTGPALAEGYFWTFGGGTPASAQGVPAVNGIVFKQPGPAPVQVVAVEGFCSDTLMQIVQVQEGPDVFDLGADTLLCSPEPGLLLNLTDIDADVYLWNDGFSGPLRTIQSAGTYVVRVERFGCSLYDSIAVTLADPIQLGLPQDTLACNVDSLWLDVGAVQAEAYRWSDGVPASGRWFAEPGYYGITAYIGPCPYSDFLYVDFAYPPPPLPADTVVCTGVPLRLTTGRSTQGMITWNNQPGYAVFVYEGAGTVVRNIEYGACVFEDSVRVVRRDCFESFHFFAPNVFSPNGDSQNDRFELFGDGLEVLTLQVYDRWGALVAENRDAPAAFWDGADARPGVFTWVAHVRQLGREGRVAGTVTVVR